MNMNIIMIMTMIRCQEEMSQQVEAIHPDEDSSLVIQKFKVKKATLIMMMRMMMIKITLLVMTKI